MEILNGPQFKKSVVSTAETNTMEKQQVLDNQSKKSIDLQEKSNLEKMQSDLASWGGGLIIIGIIQIAISGTLNPTWSVVLIVLGIATLSIKSREMFIVIGLALWATGFMNITSGGSGMWSLFGGLQFIWGLNEIRKYWRYGSSV